MKLLGICAVLLPPLNISQYSTSPHHYLSITIRSPPQSASGDAPAANQP
jgi:hypothetical protein